MSSLRGPHLKRRADTAANAFERLMEGILDGQFESGVPLREATLARQWNISRTPLRESVRRAAEGGLLVLRPNKAPVVRPFSIADARGLYDLREVLEIRAFDLAWPALGKGVEDMLGLARRAAPETRGWQQRCLQLDLALHRWWADQCGNSWLRADLDRHYQYLRIFQRWVGRDPSALAESYEDHVALVEAIAAGNRTQARRLLRRHVRHSAGLVEAAMARGTSAVEQGEKTISSASLESFDNC